MICGLFLISSPSSKKKFVLNLTLMNRINPEVNYIMETNFTFRLAVGRRQLLVVL